MSDSMETSNSTSISGYHIVPLTLDNWYTWCKHFLGIMGILGYHNHLLDSAIAVNMAIEDGMTALSSAEVKKWIDNDEQVQMRMKLAVSDFKIINFQSAKTAMEMWGNLYATHKP